MGGFWTDILRRLELFILFLGFLLHRKRFLSFSVVCDYAKSTLVHILKTLISLFLKNASNFRQKMKFSLIILVLEWSKTGQVSPL